MSQDSIFFHAPPGPSNLATTLKRDHAEFKRLWDLFNAAKTVDEKERISNELIRGISIHDVLEERFFYPELDKSKVTEGHALAEKSRGEHLLAKTSLAKLDSMKVTDPQFDDLLNHTLTKLFQHIEDEENRILPALENAVGLDRMAKLGKDVDGARTHVPTHPHPSAPDKPPGLTLAGMVAAPLDKMKDMTKEFEPTAPTGKLSK